MSFGLLKKYIIVRALASGFLKKYSFYTLKNYFAYFNNLFYFTTHLTSLFLYFHITPNTIYLFHSLCLSLPHCRSLHHGNVSLFLFISISSSKHSSHNPSPPQLSKPKTHIPCYYDPHHHCITHTTTTTPPEREREVSRVHCSMLQKNFKYEKLDLARSKVSYDLFYFYFLNWCSKIAI